MLQRGNRYHEGMTQALGPPSVSLEPIPESGCTVMLTYYCDESFANM